MLAFRVMRRLTPLRPLALLALAVLLSAPLGGCANLMGEAGTPTTQGQKLFVAQRAVSSSLGALHFLGVNHVVPVDALLEGHRYAAALITSTSESVSSSSTSSSTSVSLPSFTFDIFPLLFPLQMRPLAARFFPNP